MQSLTTDISFVFKHIEGSIVEKEVQKISSRTKAKPVEHLISKPQEEHDRLTSVLVDLENELITLNNDHQRSKQPQQEQED